jgi:hypothetical protein
MSDQLHPMHQVEENLDRVRDMQPTGAELLFLHVALRAYVELPRKLNSGNSAARCFLLELRSARQSNGISDTLVLGAWVYPQHRLPKPHVPVLLRYVNKEGKVLSTYAFHAPVNTLELHGDEDYNPAYGHTQENGEYYAAEGWYEQPPHDDDKCPMVMDEILQWLDLGIS